MQKVWGWALAKELYTLSTLLSSKYETNLSRVLELIMDTLKNVETAGVYLLDKDTLVCLANRTKTESHLEEIDLNQITPENYYILKSIEDKEIIYFYPKDKKNIIYAYNMVPHSFRYTKVLIDSVFDKSTLLVPLVFNDSVIGIVIIKGKNLLLKKLKYEGDIKTMLLISAIYFASIGRFIASVIDKQLDPLTKVSIRRSFEINFNDKLEDYKKTKAVFSLLIIDIDHFKNINDTYGHLNGDVVLRKLAKILFSSLRGRPGRNHDYLCRWGGEEFIVLLDCDKDGAKVVGERLRSAIDTAEFSVGKVTISIGVASVNETEDVSPDLLVSLADERLYKAKEQGRNRVVAE